EQCSSSPTARYKAALAASVCRSEKPVIADLTGGLGVDSFFFSTLGGEVLYVERNAGLAAAAARNFKALGADGIKTVNMQAGNDRRTESLLETFKADLVFLDPARRSSTGGKVFLLEESEPDILPMLPMLLRLSPAVLLKLSPMADLTMLRKRLGSHLSELHIVQSRGEVKELLALLERDHPGGEPLTVAADADTGASFSFLPSEEARSAGTFIREDSLQEGARFFEPGAALLKSGAFKLPCSRFGLQKFSSQTHLFLIPDAIPEPLLAFGKVWEILESMPFGSASIKETGRRHPKAEVSARGIPMKSEELRKRLGTSSGGDLHIFGAGCVRQRFLLVCRRV
ncbi:MAG: class I SAM-dependent methyltransferase, partial [Bacteroidales bacterium]|nr:class I SAM-dependent methyltransferase [Bacteroidales bacterium]